MTAPSDKRGPGRVFRLPFVRRYLGGLVDDELRFHIEQRADELVAGGLTREAALAEARRRFGDFNDYRNATLHIDTATMTGHHRIELGSSVLRELRHSVRALARTPSFSVIAIGTLALGIGATIAISTVLDAVVLRPLAYPRAHELVAVTHPATPPGSAPSQWGLSAAGYFHFRNENRSFTTLGIYTTGSATIASSAGAERIPTASVTGEVFTALGARVARGRLFSDDELRPGGPHVMLISHEFWQRYYGGDTTVLGRTIETTAGARQVVGVLAAGFALPRPSGFNTAVDLAGFKTDVWIPLQLNPSAPAVNSHAFAGVARLRPGVTAEGATRDLERMLAEFPARHPNAYSRGFIEQYRFGVAALALRDHVLGETLPRTLWLLVGAVALVLVIACANVTNLFLVRLESRRREAAMRTALGASRTHLALHYYSESALVAGTACVLGLGIAAAAVGIFRSVGPRDIPRLMEVGITPAAAGFAVLLAGTIALALGTIPLARAGIDTETLRAGTRGLGHAPRRRAARSTLVAVQVGMSVVLLAGAGLLLRSFVQLRNVDAGLDPSGVLTFGVTLPAAEYPSDASAAAFHRLLHDRLAREPGVTHAGATTALPLRDFGSGCAVVFREGRPYAENENTPCVAVSKVTPGFFETLRIDVRGRIPTWTDVDANTGAAVVTRALADRLWPGEDPVGQGINSNGPGSAPGTYFRVVGVVPALRAATLDRPPSEGVFYPSVGIANTWFWGPMRTATYVVRTSGVEPLVFAQRVRALVGELDRSVPVTNLHPMTDVVARSFARTSFATLLLGIAAALALVLSAVGLYGVVSFLVAERRAEIGIRMALGARGLDVERLVIRQALAVSGIGLIAGLGVALAGGRWIRAQLFDVSPADPAVLGGVVLVLLAVVAAASWIPARRAALVNPVETLRGP